MLRLICSALVLSTLLSLAVASWTTSTANGVTTATKGDFTFEVKVIESDPVYDTATIDAKSVFGEDVPTTVTEVQKTSLQGQMRPIHATSLNVILKHKGKVIFGLAEGKPTDFIKPANDGSITATLQKELAEAIKTLTISDERVAARLRSVPAMIEAPLQDRTKDALASVTKLGGTAGGFLELSRKVGRRQQVLTSTGAFNIRYYVDVFIGNAFGIPLGHHSATVISARNDATGAVINTFVRCNHGRCPTDNGIAYKCTHRGAATILDTAPQPASWDCTTPYWPVYCFNIFGPSHNCNANAQHQIEISDSPAAPPGDAVGICAANCPRLSPAC